MELEWLPYDLTVCKVESMDDVDFSSDVFFIGKTDQELSVVCPTQTAPRRAIEREDGWKGFRVRGTLDFSLVGILSGISAALANGGIGIFAVSTYDTDYILVKAQDRERATAALAAAGHTFA